jgi:hypothetical protein
LSVPSFLCARMQKVTRLGDSRMGDTVHVENENEGEGESESDSGWKGGFVSVWSDSVVRR